MREDAIDESPAEFAWRQLRENDASAAMAWHQAALFSDYPQLVRGSLLRLASKAQQLDDATIDRHLDTLATLRALSYGEPAPPLDVSGVVDALDALSRLLSSFRTARKYPDCEVCQP